MLTHAPIHLLATSLTGHASERADKNLKDLTDKENAARDKCIALQRQIQEAGKR
jgi:hypothetical protein